MFQVSDFLDTLKTEDQHHHRSSVVENCTDQLDIQKAKVSVIAADLDLGMDGITAFDWWCVVTEVLHSLVDCTSPDPAHTRNILVARRVALLFSFGHTINAPALDRSLMIQNNM